MSQLFVKLGTKRSAVTIIWPTINMFQYPQACVILCNVGEVYISSMDAKSQLWNMLEC